MRVTVAKSGRSFDVRSEESVLDGALRAGLNLPHSCKSGNCGACRARLITGEVSYPDGTPLGLAGSEVADGLILLCRARARGDLSIETFEAAVPEDVTVKRLPCRIERVEPLAHDVIAAFLKLPAAEPFEFRAGQYVDVLLSRGRRRSFSIASPPHASRLIELQIRLARGGEFTEPLFSGRMQGALLDIEGPLGHFVYREPSGGAAAPMLLIGGGTGLAPLVSILRHVTETGRVRDMTLYWGVRTECDLYAHAMLEGLAQRTSGFRYVPVLSEPTPGWQGAVGFVHEAVLAQVRGLARYEVYASGPPAMIDAVRRDFTAAGVDPSRLWFDSFDYAPDTLERHRMAADRSS